MRLHLTQILRRHPDTERLEVSPLFAEDTAAHLCNHAPGAPGDTQGCPRWPACLRPDSGGTR